MDITLHVKDIAILVLITALIVYAVASRASRPVIGTDRDDGFSMGILVFFFVIIALVGLFSLSSYLRKNFGDEPIIAEQPAPQNSADEEVQPATIDKDEFRDWDLESKPEEIVPKHNLFEESPYLEEQTSPTRHRATGNQPVREKPVRAEQYYYFALVIGAFSNPEKALSQMIGDPFYHRSELIERKGKVLTRVYYGDFASESVAKKFLNDHQLEGLKIHKINY